jgi:peptidoglycan hydrolase CwlO-like protein
LDGLALRLERFEKKTSADLSEIRQQLAHLSLRLDNLTARMGALEEAMLRLKGRIDALSEDMRQRFRVVHDRLSALAA